MIPKGQGTRTGPPHQYFWPPGVLISGYAKLVSEVPRCRATGLILNKFVLRHWTFGDIMTPWKKHVLCQQFANIDWRSLGMHPPRRSQKQQPSYSSRGILVALCVVAVSLVIPFPQLWCCLARCTSSWRSSPWCWMMLNGLAMFSVSHVLLSLDWDILGPAGRHMKAEIFNGRRSLRCFTCCDCPISELRKSKGPRVHSYCYDLCGGSCRAEDLEVSIRGRLGDPDECLRRWRNSDAGYRSSTFRPIFAGSHCIVRCYHAEEWGMRMLKNT